MKTVTDAVRELGGVWPNKSGGSVVIIGWRGSTTDRPADFIGWNKGGYCLEITRTQFESEAERLRNKPSWQIAPPDYEWLWQNADGEWIFGKGHKPQEESTYFSTSVHFLSHMAGKVLGDWRDTLEQRPYQEQGTDWHKRGELPPVGTECEAYYMHGATTRWRRVEILKHVNRECAVFCPDIYSLGWCNTFRPIRTDRERWVEQASAEFVVQDWPALGRLYDAMIDGTLTIPGDNQ